MATCTAIVTTETEPDAPSYVNERGSVPTIVAETMTAFAAPVPAGCSHLNEVTDTQLLVVHRVAPIDMDSDESVRPKFNPVNVCVEPPVVGPFAAIKDVATGAAPRHRSVP